MSSQNSNPLVTCSLVVSELGNHSMSPYLVKLESLSPHLKQYFTTGVSSFCVTFTPGHTVHLAHMHAGKLHTLFHNHFPFEKKGS